jgi:hypothetical protein
MKLESKKIVMVVQDLKSKEGTDIAVCSLDVHYIKDGKKHIASAMMSLDSNKEFKRMVAALATQAVDLKEGLVPDEKTTEKLIFKSPMAKNGGARPGAGRQEVC